MDRRIFRAVVGVEKNEFLARQFLAEVGQNVQVRKGGCIIFNLLRGWEKLLHRRFVGLEGVELIGLNGDEHVERDTQLFLSVHEGQGNRSSNSLIPEVVRFVNTPPWVAPFSNCSANVLKL